MTPNRLYIFTAVSALLVTGAIYLAGANLQAVAAEAPAASAPTQEPLSIKDRDIRKAARLLAAVMICDPISGKAIPGLSSSGLELKVEYAYGKEAAKKMTDVYREILNDLDSKAYASRTASIAANGIFAKPKFDECEEAKRLANQD